MGQQRDKKGSVGATMSPNTHYPTLQSLSPVEQRGSAGSCGMGKAGGGSHNPGQSLLTASPPPGELGGAGTHQEAKLCIRQEEDHEGQPCSHQLLHGLLKGLPEHGPLPDKAQLLGRLGPSERTVLGVTT